MGGIIFALVIAGFLLTGARSLAAVATLVIASAYYFIPADDYGPEIALLLVGVAALILLVRLLLKAIALRAKK